MNTAIKILEEMIEEHTRLANENPRFFDHNNGYVIGLNKARNKISSLPSLDSQWINKLEKELEEEDKDIDSLDDYYMGMSVGKSSMLNRIKKLLFNNN